MSRETPTLEVSFPLLLTSGKRDILLETGRTTASLHRPRMHEMYLYTQQHVLPSQKVNTLYKTLIPKRQPFQGIIQPRINHNSSSSSSVVSTSPSSMTFGSPTLVSTRPTLSCVISCVVTSIVSSASISITGSANELSSRVPL